MRATPWLELAGVEVANANRTLTYLRRGLGDPLMQVMLRSPRLVETDCGYSDIYSDTYEGYCHYTPANLACFCEATSDFEYRSPALDPAPWYDADRPESEDFMGLFVPNIEIQSVLARSVTPRTVGGGVVSRLRPKSRLVSVSGYMYATNPQGMSWGERWLEHVLSGSPGGCAPDLLRLLPACPEEADAERFFRELHGAGVAGGPDYGPVQQVRGCTMQTVTFDIAVSSEYLRAPGVELIEERPLTPAIHYALLEGPGVVGDAGAIITIRAGAVGSSLQNVVITARPTSADACPSSEPASFAFTVAYVPRGGYIVIDAAARTVLVYDVAGDVYASLDSLTWSGLWEWMTVAAGQQVCISIDATAAMLNAGSLVSVISVDREL